MLSKNSVLYRFLCLSWVLFTVIPRNSVQWTESLWKCSSQHVACLLYFGILVCSQVVKNPLYVLWCCKAYCYCGLGRRVVSLLLVPYYMIYLMFPNIILYNLFISYSLFIFLSEVYDLFQSSRRIISCFLFPLEVSFHSRALGLHDLQGYVQRRDLAEVKIRTHF